jgi:hypothetical protein
MAAQPPPAKAFAKVYASIAPATLARGVPADD